MSIKKTTSQNGSSNKNQGVANAEILTPTNMETTLTKDISHLQTAIDSSWASIEFSPDGIILSANDIWIETLGYDREEIVGKHHRMFCDPNYAGSLEYTEFWKNLKNGKIQSGEFMRIKKDGDTLWINASYTPVMDENNVTIKIIKIAMDITDMVNARMRGDAVKSAVDTGWASIEFDPTGIILDVNENWVKTLGYTKDQMIGKHHRIFCDEIYASSSEYQSFWSDLAAGHINSGEFKRIKKGGEEFWINASYTPIKNSSGKVYKVIKIANEITQQKLRNADYKGQIDAVDKAQAIIEFNLDGTVIKANTNFLSAVGYTSDEVKGKHHRIFCELTYANSEEYREFWNKLNRGEYVTGDFERKHKNGNSIWLQATYNPILDLNGNVYKVVKYATDITQQKRALEELKRVVNVIIQHGNLNERAQLNGASGSELILLESINQLMDGISEPILAVSNVIKSLSQGDLTVDISLETRGDIKAMAEGLSTAMNTLNHLLGEISESSNLLASSSEEMLTKSDQMQGTTAQVASAIGQMAEGVADQARQIDDSSKLIDGVRQSAEQMGQQATTINEAAKKGQSNAKRGLERIESVVESMSQIAKSASLTSTSIEVLTQRSEEIAQTLNVIRDIAGQTNLLALNAAIEAARAGDAGRGFAVVAEEIRKLAEDSKSSAGDIERVIKAVEKDILQAGKAINDMGTSVNSGNEASQEAESVFKEIDASIVETLGLSEKVLTATEIQRVNIDETVKNIEKIVVVAEETSSGTEQIATSSKDLSNGMEEFNASSIGLADIANQLRLGVSKFTLKSLN